MRIYNEYTKTLVNLHAVCYTVKSSNDLIYLSEDLTYYDKKRSA